MTISLKLKYLTCLLTSIIIINISLFAQKINTTAYKITYKQYSNGKYQENRNFDIIYSNGICYLSKDEDKIRSYIDLNKKINVNIIGYNDTLFKTLSHFDNLPIPISLNDSIEMIGKHKCKKAVYSSFSNTIEVWYNNKLAAKGSPYANFLPDYNSLVLKTTINGNRSIVFDTIQEINIDEIPAYPFEDAIEITDPEFEEFKILSRYIIIPVFDNERINFNTELPKINLTDTLNDKTYHLSNGGVILKKIKLPEIAKKGAYCFARLNVKSDGDAYDRTGSVFVIHNDSQQLVLDALNSGIDILPVIHDKNGEKYQGIVKTETYAPPIELMRFFTSFGAGNFNTLRPINNYNWADDILYKQEITNLIPDDIDEIWIGVFIGNYDKNGHEISLELDFYPSWEAENDTLNKFILPLFNTVNIMEMSGQNYCKLFKTDTLQVEFYLPEGLINPQLIFTTTGHGGWGNGDEFVPKLNQIFIDDNKVFEISPWRTDCATYRLNNPASGNFGNGLSSSDLSRSNWCPGTLTPPYFIPLTGIKSGKHNIRIIIDQGEDEGNSFNHWSVSGVISSKFVSSHSNQYE
ncbi:MAG: PNGase F N-terminal domain-containing protein [Bacteroidales bacterium]|nr:PNGase F N-terminal domain-containing protein [Bacteroidales bacterium]